MTINAEESQSINQEVETLEKVLNSLEQQLQSAGQRIRSEAIRARDLTSQIVAATREEDKAMLASDEAVSHGLLENKRDELDVLKKQLEKPYFARIILNEEDLDTGAEKIIEYKLGFTANPDCRIIDWRKAPISKLYYEYKEGDEYSEEILGRERVGKVALRNRVEIAQRKLTGVTNRLGSFTWDPKSGEWVNKSSNRKSSDASLPEILSLITPDQFKLITEDAETAILIQGIAGSGKTTVAIHRLAWLLHEDNSALKEDECAVIVLSPALKNYIQNSLPSAGITGVKVHTYHEWCVRTLKWAANSSDFTYSRPLVASPSSIERVKRSMALLKALEEYVSKQEDRSYRTQFSDLQNDLLTVLNNPEWILSKDETKLLDKKIIEASHERTRLNFKESFFDWADDALLLRIYELKVGNIITEKKSLGRYRHLVIDEVQDFSPIELATIIGGVDHIKNLTLVGDADQNINAMGTFPGWEKLLKNWNFGEETSKYVSLTVSHRSTLPIMRLAGHIQGKELATKGRQGRVPIWFKCRTEQDGIGAVLKWLSKALELYPTRLTAVICTDSNEAHFAYKMLQPTFGPTVRLGDQYSFTFEEGILVTDVRQVKGLEFFSVLIWNPSAKNFPDNELSRNLLYVAVTRAEENLALVTWSRPSSHLPYFGRSQLVRSMDMTIVEEES